MLIRTLFLTYIPNFGVLGSKLKFLREKIASEDFRNYWMSCFIRAQNKCSDKKLEEAF